jgi:signal transduction protein with GAF and PtsI domain
MTEMNLKESSEDLTYKLHHLSAFIESQVSLDANLHELVLMAANIMQVQNCSIMLLKDEEDVADITLRVFAHSGHLSEVASREAMKIKEGIAGHVVTTGRPLFIEDIDRSKYAPLKRGNYNSKGFISVPIIIHEKVAGVINANTPKRKPALTKKDFELLEVVSLLIGKSIQVIQLQNLLRSRYVQFAIVKEKEMNEVPFCHSNDELAKILARTFYSEMIKAGFAPDHMITTATEILTLLNKNQSNEDSQNGRHCKVFDRNSEDSGRN